MGIKNIVTSITGLSGVQPSIIYIDTVDTLATVTVEGYLNSAKQEGYTFYDSQMALVTTSDLGPTFLQVEIINDNVSLVAQTNPGTVITPVTEGHIATYVNNNGGLHEDPAVAISNGNIQAGVNGGPGWFISYPLNVNTGNFVVKANPNSGNYTTTLSNAAMGQNATINLPDPGTGSASVLLTNAVGTQTVATGNLTLTAGNLTLTAGSLTVTAGSIFGNGGAVYAGTSSVAGTVTAYAGDTSSNCYLELLPVTNSGHYHSILSTSSSLAQDTTFILTNPANATAKVLVGAGTSPFTSGHLLQASGTAGLVADAGLAISALQQVANIKASVTANIGGAGAGPLTVTVTGLTSSSIVVATVQSSSNPCYVQSIAAGSGNFVVTMNTNPGATLILNYVAFVAAQ